jgi:hypothetical protein
VVPQSWKFLPMARFLLGSAVYHVHRQEDAPSVPLLYVRRWVQMDTQQSHLEAGVERGDQVCNWLP